MMKKIVILMLTFLLNLVPSLASAQNPPVEPDPTVDSWKNYKIVGTTNWGLGGNLLINTVQIEYIPTAVYRTNPETQSLEVRYRFYGSGTMTKGLEPYSEIFNASLYVFTGETNNSLFEPSGFANRYFILVREIEGKKRAVAILYYDRDNAAYHFDAGGRTDGFSEAEEGKQDINNNWFARYLKAEVPVVKNNKPVITTITAVTDCKSRFNNLVKLLNEAKTMIYTFALNGCSEATPQNPCRDQKRYIRPKDSGEIISDAMKPYLEAFGKMKEIDPGGFVKALTADYEVDQTVFTAEGMALYDQLAQILSEANTDIYELEKNCDAFIKDKNNYPQEIRKWNPDLPKEKINDWASLKAVYTQMSFINDLIGKHPTATVSGPLSDENAVLKKVICWVRDIVLKFFYFEANLAGYFLRRNY